MNPEDAVLTIKGIGTIMAISALVFLGAGIVIGELFSFAMWMWRPVEKWKAGVKTLEILEDICKCEPKLKQVYYDMDGDHREAMENRWTEILK